MLIRPYTSADSAAALELFRYTVKTVNARDYTPLEIASWLREEDVDPAAWSASFHEKAAWVAVGRAGKLVGFADCDAQTGLIDRLFVHPDHQSKGIGSALLTKLEAAVADNVSSLTVFASLTARSFFERHGYAVGSDNVVRRSFHHHGKLLTVDIANFRMQKSRPTA